MVDVTAVEFGEVEQPISQPRADDHADKARGAKRADHFGDARHRRPARDISDRGPEEPRQARLIEHAQAVNQRPVHVADEQMREARCDKHRRRNEPNLPRAVGVDADALPEPHGQAADHADRNNPAQVDLIAVEKGHEIAVAIEQADGDHQQKVRAVGQPEGPAKGGALCGLAAGDWAWPKTWAAGRHSGSAAAVGGGGIDHLRAEGAVHGL